MTSDMRPRDDLRYRFTLITVLLIGAILGPAQGSAQVLGTPATMNDSVAVVDALNAYHRALANADTSTAVELLAPHAVILESGGSETRAEYLSHHLPADIAFAAAVPSERALVHLSVQGALAWAASTSATRGSFRGRNVDSLGAELIVFEKLDGSWKISAIHWSSRNRPAN